MTIVSKPSGRGRVQSNKDGRLKDNLSPEHRSIIGHKGGATTSRNRQHMAAIGKLGGQRVSQDRAHMVAIARLPRKNRNLSSGRMVERAAKLAIKAHAGQKYGELEYRWHLEQVVAVLQQFYLASPDLIAAAWLHDVIEDTMFGVKEMIDSGIPQSVIDIVIAVTDEPGANRAERKAKTYPKIAASRDAVIIKLADRIANIKSNEKFDMYKKEYPAFKLALFNSEHGLSGMWDYLDSRFSAPPKLNENPT